MATNDPKSPELQHTPSVNEINIMPVKEVRSLLLGFGFRDLNKNVAELRKRLIAFTTRKMKDVRPYPKTGLSMGSLFMPLIGSTSTIEQPRHVGSLLENQTVDQLKVVHDSIIESDKLPADAAATKPAVVQSPQPQNSSAQDTCFSL